ncbi:hypothetical protein SH611_20125 [Geminicoccaceae bacterium 1502E]|nr:hypothetical protein [Geminicoccaceae bacterium 1502E]
MTTQPTDKTDSRREFLARAGKAATAAPAIGLVLAAATKPALAGRVYRKSQDGGSKKRGKARRGRKNKD